ncbi:MAG: GNAT family N-acetyltransferase [Planctomycetota bacterium]
MNASPTSLILDDFRRRLCAYGPMGLVKRAAIRGWRQLAYRGSLIFRWSVQATPVDSRADVRVVRCTSSSNLPAALNAELARSLGPRYPQTIQDEFSNHGVLHLALIHDQLAALHWIRAGSHVPAWFVPLDRQDVVVFGCVTLPQHRGRGIMPWLVTHSVKSDGVPAQYAFADCRVWNRPAHRVFAKAGFECIGRAYKFAWRNPSSPHAG